MGVARLLAATAFIAPSAALAQVQTGTCFAQALPSGGFAFSGSCQASSSSLIGLTGTGATGPNGSGADLFYSATDGGPGATGPAFTFDLLSGSQLLQQASAGNGLYFSTTGGTGGIGGHDAVARHAGDGGSGGDGGVIIIDISATSAVSTTGDNSDAIYAISSGGTGGQGGADVDGGLGDGNGGPGGNGGDITVDNDGTLSTAGVYSSAIFAHSDGGTGGAGAPAQSFFGNGGSGGVGGNSGADVTARNAGTASTSGDNATAIVLQSVGGNGGDGGGGQGAFYSQGGNGGSGGNGEDIQFANRGTIQTQGDYADAVNAYSIGGGGGHGGSAVTAGGLVGVAIGGSGGGGGDSGSVALDNFGTIIAAGTNAKGMVGSSIGGGGGDANAVTNVTYGPGAAWNFSFGGSGGMGGTGGAVVVDNHRGGTIVTGAPTSNAPQDPGNVPIPGDHASGILAQSLGGGGGHGAQTVSVSASAGYASFALGVALGGTGGAGGSGGTVSVTSDGSITTHARLADGILAQSIGGGGGKGGTSINVDASVGEYAGNLSIVLGGNGGNGGNGDAVSVDLGGAISTYSSQSRGIFAQSIGGGGGSGGNIINVDAAVGSNAANLSVSLGGTGGGGGYGSSVSVTTDAGSTIATLGHYSDGILAQSIGGGGGGGGSVNSYAISAINGSGLAASAGVGVGGLGGSGGAGGDVTVSHGGAITTAGDFATGLFAQSVGGGGGVGGSVFELSIAASLDAQNAQGNALGGRDIAASIAVGGAGGAGNVGGDVTVSLQSGSSIVTTGESAAGIIAQSIGGGGGAGGIAHSFAVSTPVPTSPQRLADLLKQWRAMAEKIFSSQTSDGPAGQYQSGLQATISVGGNGGDAGIGGNVIVNLASNASIQTSGSSSHGVYALSIGGGGGIGGMANSDGFAGFGEFGLALSLGGNGGNDNDGGSVDVVGSGPDGTTAGIVTAGQLSHGIAAQSVGGGGGSSASGGTGSTSDHSIPGLSRQTVSMAIGGNAGAQGDGGSVRVIDAPNIVTSGGGSDAIFAQSVGGGGGLGGAGSATGLIDISLGGKGGAGGNGSTVRIKGDSILSTSGSASAGIFAQSVGGGGGAAGISNATLFGLQAGFDLRNGGIAGNGGQGGNVDVTWNGRIQTTGAVSIGIFAQSIGGGGGAVAANDLTIVGGAVPFYSLPGGGVGNGGTVTVGDLANDPLRLSTSGDGAHGIVAQSIGGGGVGLFADQPTELFDVIWTAGGTPNGMGGSVIVTLNGSVATSGANAYGIVAQSLTNATVLFGTDGIEIVQEPTPSAQGAVQVILQGSVTTQGVGAHGIATYMNTTQAGNPVVQATGTVNVSGAGAWGIYTTNGQDGFGAPSTEAFTTDISIQAGGTINATGAAAGAINMADWNGEATADIWGALNAPDAVALQSNAAGLLNVHSGGVVLGDIVATGGDFILLNEGSITGSVSGVSTYAIGGGSHFLRFDPTATLGSDSIAVQQLEVPSNSIHPVLIALPNGNVTATQIIETHGGADLTPVPADQVGSFGLSSGTIATQYDYDFTLSTATIADVSIDFTRGGFSGNTQQLASAANNQLLGWAADAPTSPSALYTLLLNASNATTSAELSQYLQNLDATASYAAVQQSAMAASAAHTTMQSCGNPVGLYSLIDQSPCNWGKATYAVTTLRDGDQRDTTTGISIGRQDEASDNVYVGGSFAYDWTSFDGVGSSSDGNRVSLGAIAKYVEGPVYASASVVGSYGWADGSRYSSLSWVNGVATADQETWALTGRLRAGYVFDVGAVELMPLVDFDVQGIFDQGYTEQGLDDLALQVSNSNNVLFDLRPALRIGGTTKVNDAYITNHVEIGALFALNEGSVDVSLPNGPNPTASVPLALERDDVMATIALGSSIDWGAYELRLQYEGALGDTTVSQAGSVKFAIKF
ncbi:hypothetical protein C3941_17770 [Kaistia algarum]|nr:hypothetical protein C3941_17770 [Kaistia algarum]